MDNYDEIHRFSSIILSKCENSNVEYLDAVTSYCEENELEIESIIPLLSPALKSKIEEEALKLKLIKTSTIRLDI